MNTSKPVKMRVFLKNVFNFYRKDIVFSSFFGFGIGSLGLLLQGQSKMDRVVDGLSAREVFDFVGMVALICCLSCLFLCDLCGQDKNKFHVLEILIDFTDWCCRKAIDLFLVFFSASMPFFIHAVIFSPKLEHKIGLPFVTVAGGWFFLMLSGLFYVFTNATVREVFVSEANPLLRFSFYYIMLVGLVWHFFKSCILL